MLDHNNIYDLNTPLSVQELTPMDLYFYRPGTYTIQFLYKYNYHIDRFKLERAVSNLLKTYPLLGSRITPRGNSVFLEPFCRGISIKESRINSKNLPEVSDDSFFDPVKNLPSEPLIKIKLNHVDDQTYLGLSFSHILGDGQSLVLFMKALACSYKGDLLPVINFDRRAVSDLKRSLDINPRSLFVNTGYCYPRPPNPKHSVEFFEYIDLNHVESLKSYCLERKNIKLSKNVIIMSLLFKKYYEMTSKNPEGKYILRCPVDYRQRHTGIPNNYFGNAVTDAFIELSPEKIPSLSVEDIAVLMKSAIERIDKDRVENSLGALDSYRIKKGIGAFENLSCPGFLFSNFTRLPFQEFDFGQGGPVDFRHCSMNPRLAVILKKGKGIGVKVKLPLNRSNKNGRF